MKVTDINIGKYFGVTTQTLRNYKNGDEHKKRLYVAMVREFKRVHNIDY